MKFKPIYLYGLVIIIAAVTLIIVTQSSDGGTKTDNITNKQMPDDNIHKNLGHGMMQNPSGANVSEEVKQKLDLMKKEVESNPTDTIKIREYADLLAAAHRPDEAISYYERIIQKDKSRKDIYFAIAFVYYNQKDFVKAEEVTREMSRLFPDDAMVNYNLGAIEATKGNKEKAREIWNKLIKDYPNDKTSELAKNSLNRL